MLKVETGDVFVLATDGVYEHVGARFDRQGRSATTRTIWTGPPGPSSRRPTSNGSPDNLTVQIVRIDEVPARRGAASCSGRRPSCRCRRCSKREWCSTDTGSSASCTAAAAATSISRSTPTTDALVVLKIPSIDLRGDPDLSQALHDGGVGRAAHQQRACAEALPAVAEAQLSLRRHGIHRRADADPVDDRQSEARSRDRCAASSSRSPGGCRRFTGWRCCIRTCGPTTS